MSTIFTLLHLHCIRLSCCFKRCFLASGPSRFGKRGLRVLASFPYCVDCVAGPLLLNQLIARWAPPNRGRLLFHSLYVSVKPNFAASVFTTNIKPTICRNPHCARSCHHGHQQYA